MLPFAKRIVVAVLLAHCLAGTARSETSSSYTPDIQAAFEPKLFDLAYTVFLANSSLPEASAVAERALAARPSDAVWLERAAQAAEWNGRPDLALTHWFQLAGDNNQEARNSALRLSRALNELPLRKMLLEQNLSRGDQNPALLREYLAVVEGLGLPQEAYDLLISGKFSGNTEYVLAEQARLAEMLGRPKDAIAAWSKVAQLRSLNPAEALKLASLWYGQGDRDQAWLALQMAAHSAPPSAATFWRTYADLAWARQEVAEATRVSRMLIDQGNAEVDDYERLIMTARLDNQDQAYAVALAGWQRFHLPLFWHALAEAGMASGREHELVAFLKGLKDDQRLNLAKDARAMMLAAQVYHQAGDTASSLSAAKSALLLAPDNGEIISSYFWLLIDMQQTTELRRLVRDWEWRIVRLPELREPLAAAMMLFGNPTRALQLYRVLALERQNDPAWLASYGDVLEQAGHPEAAWSARRQAQFLVERRLRTSAESPESFRRYLISKAQLLMHLAPGDSLMPVMLKIANGKQTDFSRMLVMGWAMATGQTDLARFWYWRALARTAQRMDWAILGLALEANDRPAIADLIESSLEKLPYRDAVEGARRSGQILLAETIAFEQFQVNDRDYLLDKQVRELFYPHPARFVQLLSLQEQSGVGFLEETASFSYPVTKRLALAVELNNTEIRHQKRGVVREYVSNSQRGLLSLKLRHEYGVAGLSAGVTDAFSSFATLEFSSDWRLYNRLVLDVGLRLGWQAPESVPLRIAGLKDEASLGLLAELTPRDTLLTRLTYRNLRDQERRMLGNGMSVEGELTHRLLLDWPDTNLHLFGGYHRFERKGTPVGRTLAMIPAGAADDYYIPESFGQIGFGMNFGQYHRIAYSRQWLPFGTVDLSWNSVGGTGFRYELGMAGPIFGLDKLEGAFSQESGRFGNSDVNSRIDIRYLYNLN
ncbi:MAG: tetratricopeptide repeat protein [Geobacter sp.]|nr:tetratricopeptide repeat protein [Geobacter sp.]